MNIILTFPEINALIARMEARLSTWKPGDTGLSPIEMVRKELEEGKEIPIAEVKAVNGGLLSYRGEQVILYIKDTRQDRETLLYDQDNARKFHIAECRTLESMRYQGRFERYVVTTNRSGMFKVEATDSYSRAVEELEVPLYVCRNCLTTLDWKHYTSRGKPEKDNLRNEFSLDDFFAEYSTFFYNRPTYSDETAPRGGYAKNWSTLSESYRAERHWTCEECGVCLAEHRALLHCHHKNGVTSDNKKGNIEALCILCHSTRPAHGYLKPEAKVRLLIERLRIEHRSASPTSS